MSQYSSPATYSISSIIRGKARVATASTIIQYISLYYFIVILTGNVLDQSVHKGPSERLRCSLNQITGRKTEKKIPRFLPQKASRRFFQGPRAGEKPAEQFRSANTTTCRPQKSKRRNPARKCIVSSGFSRAVLYRVNAKVKVDTRDDQRKEWNLSEKAGQALFDHRLHSTRPRNQSNTGMKPWSLERFSAWWAGLHSDWLVLGLRARTKRGSCRSSGPGWLGVFPRPGHCFELSTEAPDP